mmetsp:Transcript_8251/g.24802  ORF Transcript_8251/g.24802 Transcript_8251/m.24802 type:complete len:1111 (-) Transcript_8251:334-3666(-)
MRQESHRVYLQTFAPRSAAAVAGPSLGGGGAGTLASGAASLASGASSSQPSSAPGGRAAFQHATRPILTSSAAIRLTDGATTCDVTKLLRAKFGWPPLRVPDPPPPPTVVSPTKKKESGGALDRINARLAEFRGDEDKSDEREDGDGPPIRTIAVASSPQLVAASSDARDGERPREGESDALVLVGTVTGLPINYVRFEHELEKDDGVVEPSAGDQKIVAMTHVPNLVEESKTQDLLEKSANSPKGTKSEDAGRDVEKRISLECSDILTMHKGLPERRRMGSKESLASAATVKASGACRQTSDWSTLDFSLSTRGDPIPGLDLSSSSQGRKLTELDTSCYRPGPQPASSLSAVLFAAGADQKQREQEGSQPSTPTMRNGPQSRLHRRTSSGDGLSTSRRNGEPISSPSSWTESLIGVPRGRVGTIVTEEQLGIDASSRCVAGGSTSADAAALGVGATGYAQGLDRPGPVDPVAAGRDARHHAHRGMHQPQRHHRHRHRHHRQEEYAISQEPYNLVRTLKPHENPLLVRDEIAAVLGERQRHAEAECGVPSRRKRRAPTFRWFFQPCAGDGGGNGKIRSVPSCVDIDGYCSGAESTDDDSCSSSTDEDGPDKVKRDALLDATDGKESEQGSRDKQGFSILDRHHCYHKFSSSCFDEDAEGRNRRCTNSSLVDERHRLTILSQREGSATGGDGQCVSGYLLKRSRSDPNVWRRVHCVLIDDQLWYVSRVYPLDNENQPDESSGNLGKSSHLSCPFDRDGIPSSSLEHKQHFSTLSNGQALPRKQKRIGRHRVVRLTRSLLVESDPASRDATPLSRTPHAFEICTSRGDMHVFRAMRRSVQQRWADCLCSRIVRGHEDKFMEMADLIVTEETCARGRRMEELAATAVLGDGVSSWAQVRYWGPSQRGGKYLGSSRSGEGDILLNAVRFGAEVAEYRELCQRARVTISDCSIELHRQSGGTSANHTDQKEGDHRCQDLALAAWESAEDVLSKSHIIVRSLEGRLVLDASNNQSNEGYQDIGDKVDAEVNSHIFPDIESIQKQISDLIEEGRVQILVKSVALPSSMGARDNDHVVLDSANGLLPPLELFDVLLSILQRLSSDCTISTRSQQNTSL